MATEKRNTQNTNEVRYRAQLDQAGISFGEIASTANCIGELCIDAISELPGSQQNQEAVARQLVIIQKLAQQIGLICDLTSDKIERGANCIHGGAEDWLFPPTWHWAAEKVAANPETTEPTT